ncbi:MAG: glycoside hydrolase N-terminal domain-containing protein [Pedobacter sp.]|nr:glycoside hydrolase N-terminal domain-containing protein [Pedobacter sp.]
MKIRLRSFLFLLLVGTTGFAQQSHYQLWYKQPAQKWTDALPIGNGRLGAMIFGQVAHDRLQFNEETLWSGGPRNYNLEGASAALPEIRKLLAAGKQKEAEELAQAQFMGTQSEAGDRKVWDEAMRAGKGITGNPALPNYDDRNWKTITVPSYEGWEAVGLQNIDGAVWFRTTFEVPENWKGKDLVLDLNRIRDQDFTYVNGSLVGHTATADPRKYTIPAKLIRVGKNSLSIQVLNYYDKGGLAGYKDASRPIGIYPQGGSMANGISLVKKWKYKIQDTEPPAVAQYQASYQPFGNLELHFKHSSAYTNYRRTLDLNTAIATTSYTVSGTHYVREYFASQPHQAIAVHLTANRRHAITVDASLSSPHLHAQLKALDQHTLSITFYVKDGALKGESRLTAVVKNGTVKLVGHQISIVNADEVTFWLTAGTNFINDSEVNGNPATANTKALAALKGKTYEAVKAAHVAEYQSYYHAFDLSLGSPIFDQQPTDERIEKFASQNDPNFAALYVQYARYLLISSSRPGTQPANLQGIWNELLSPPWGSKYTTNINLEMNYWPSEVLNLPGLNEPLFSKMRALAKKGQETAKTYYNASGWVLHHNTDLWNGTAPINASNHGIWVGGGAWLGQHLWEHYLFGRDRQFLANEAYPLMKGAALFFVDFLVKDPKTGWLISTPSNSPENGGLVAGPTMDHQLVRSLFLNCIAAAEELKTDEPFRKLLKEKVAQIAPNQIGRYGQLQEWLEDKDDTTNKHRHVSHLWGVYPGNDISWDKDPKMMEAAKQSLIYRGDEATGWSLAWKINWWARFRDGEHALKLINMLIRPATANGAGSYVNLFDAHPPFQIDGNFGGAAGIAEMLVQSHEKYIDILPALPLSWPQGEVRGLRARGGFDITMKWNNGRLESLAIHSTIGGNCIIRYQHNVVSIATEAGKTYHLNGELKP